MAAYAALLSLMRIIDDIQTHHSPPISLDEQQAQSLIEKVSFLQEFLQGYASPIADIDDEADPLEIRIADAAYAAEDVIESNIVDAVKLSNGEEVKCREEVISCINLYEDLHKVIEEMDVIKKMAVKINAEKEAIHDQVSASSDASLTSSSIKHSSVSMVCSDDVLLGLMEKLVRGQPGLQVVPIVGMGGIGKTTLAINLYARPLIKEYFDICAWATISQQYNIREVLCELVSQATNKKKEAIPSERSEDEIGLELYKYLFRRRFLIVMDDMWSVDAWDKIQLFLPNNDNGSRIMVTTRLSQLSSQLNNSYCHQMEFLDEVSSKNLFYRILFGEETCPLELDEIGKEIVENCRGLPLSIVVVGGLLKKVEHSQGCWELIKNNLTSEVNLGNDKHCLRLLKMSYNHLPVYLKPCFLYMAVFEEDSRILVSRLIKLWVSQGFLKSRNGKSLETIGKGFLKELVDRNLILIDELGATGNIKYCKIHDLLRDLCMRESQKYDFYYVVGECSLPQRISSQRRVVIHRGNSKHKDLDALHSMSHTRSVMCESEEVSLCRNFGLLRTLEAYHNLSNRSYVSSFVFQCVNLRHLVVKLYRASSFLSSLDVFWNLHTLIVDCWEDDFNELVVGIWKMPQLRHIEFTTESLCLPDPPLSNGGDDVLAMEILKGVKNFKCGEEVVKRIPNVKKLGIRYRDHEDDYRLSNIKGLCKLESLKVSCEYNSRGAVVSSLHELTFPCSLKSLTLWMNSGEFEWEEMLEKIGSLVEKLILCNGCFRSGKWEIVEGQFPSLKYLSLRKCGGLERWTAQESCIFPRLEQLRLYDLEDLMEIPCEIGDIPTLQIIELFLCSESVVVSVKDIVEEQVELQGEQLPFRVKVCVSPNNEALLSLAAPNFDVDIVYIP